jgi:hypothetical protein
MGPAQQAEPKGAVPFFLGVWAAALAQTGTGGCLTGLLFLGCMPACLGEPCLSPF